MQDRHLDRKRYFREQVVTTEKYVIPYLKEFFTPEEGRRVLEIGCGEGGNLQPFLDAGCTVSGIDLAEGKIEKARTYFDHHPLINNLELICRDIYQLEIPAEKFDLILLRDVIEHIHDQEKFLAFVQKFLSPGGLIFFAFPPWQNPFGGHQQICRNRWLSHTPWIHLLPLPLYTALLRWGGESEATIAALTEIRDTRLSIEKFELLLNRQQYQVKRKTFFLINPNYEIKFGFQPRKTPYPLTTIPWLRNFFTTTAYYLVVKIKA